MKTANTRFGIRVGAAPTSDLGAHVAGMTPDTWSELATTGLDAAILDTGVAKNILTFGNGGRTWSETYQQLHFLGGDHNGGVQRNILYTASNNTWSIPAQDGWLAADDTSFQNHAYCYNTMDTNLDRFYYRDKYYWDIASQQWVDIAGIESSEGGPIGNLERAHDAYSFIEGANGYHAFHNGEDYFLPSGGSTWQGLRTGSTYNTSSSVSMYNPRSGICVYGGGDPPTGVPDDRRLFKRDDSLVFTELSQTNIPYLKATAGLNCNGDNSTYIIDNPTNGNFFVMGPDHHMWDFDAENEIWTDTGTMESKGFAPAGGVTSWTDYAVFSISSFGALVFLEQVNQSTGKMWVYKV